MTMAMLTSGHVAHARALINEDFFLAWGDLGAGYLDPWAQDQEPPLSTSALFVETITKGAEGTSDQLAKPGVMRVVSIIDTDGVQYVVASEDSNGALVTAGADCYLDSGRINWSLPGSEPLEASEYTVVYRYYEEDLSTLINEVGRRRASEKSFVVEDPVSGDIVANDKKWRRVAHPTEHIYLAFRFESTEAVNTSIYQTGLFIGTETDPNLPVGQQYFLPSEVVDIGSAYMFENVEPFPRNAGKREIFEYVISF